MEEVIRDFKREEAPGRSRKSASRSNAAATTIRRLEEKSFTAPLLELRGASSFILQTISLWKPLYQLPDKLESTLPAGLIEKVQHNFAQKQNAIAPGGLAILVIRRLGRAVNEHGTPDDVFLWDESPVAAIEAHAAMVAHGKVVLRRNDNVISLDVGLQIYHPVGINIGIIRGRHRGKIIPVRIVGIPVVQHIRLVQSLTDAVQHAITDVNFV